MCSNYMLTAIMLGWHCTLDVNSMFQVPPRVFFTSLFIKAMWGYKGIKQILIQYLKIAHHCVFKYTVCVHTSELHTLYCSILSIQIQSALCWQWVDKRIYMPRRLLDYRIHYGCEHIWVLIPACGFVLSNIKRQDISETAPQPTVGSPFIVALN